MEPLGRWLQLPPPPAWCLISMLLPSLPAVTFTPSLSCAHRISKPIGLPSNHLPRCLCHLSSHWLFPPSHLCALNLPLWSPPVAGPCFPYCDTITKLAEKQGWTGPPEVASSSTSCLWQDQPYPSQPIQIHTHQIIEQSGWKRPTEVS